MQNVSCILHSSGTSLAIEVAVKPLLGGSIVQQGLFYWFTFLWVPARKVALTGLAAAQV